MEIVPNLHFNGDCEAALKLYEQAFGAQRTVFLHYKDADPADMDPVAEEDIRDYVYHAEMVIGNQRMMLTDHTDQIPHGVNLSLLVSFDSLEALRSAYEIMKEGARILIPWTETTYSSGFVSLVDRYGQRWELMVEN